MESVWAPWRIEYFIRPKEDGCFLCRMYGEQDDRRNLLLLRGKACAVVMNRYPYTGGHLMVCPYRHIATLGDLTPEECAELMALTKRSIDVLSRAMKPQGFNVGIDLGSAAGAGLKDHLHQHIVPRWSGDTNFMSVVGDIRVVPEALDALWEKLKPAFDHG